MRAFWVCGEVTVSERLGAGNDYRIRQPLEEGGLEAHDVLIRRGRAGKPDLDSVPNGALLGIARKDLPVRIHHGEAVACYIQPGDVDRDLVLG